GKRGAEKIDDRLIHSSLRFRPRMTDRRRQLACRHFPCPSCPRPPPVLDDYSAASALSPPGACRCCFELCKSTLRPSDRISLTSTWKHYGRPASNVSSPRTIAS